MATGLEKVSFHSNPKESESESHSVMSDSLQPHGLYGPWNSPSQNTEVGSLSLLQQIFQTQELNRGLLHRRRILYQLSHQGSPLLVVVLRKITPAVDVTGDRSKSDAVKRNIA